MSSRVPFSQRPGRHERHFRRKLDNRLFPQPVLDYTDEQLLEVQRLYHEELLGFVTHLRQLVQQAVDLKPNEESQVILDLKSDLDKAYEKASTLADDQAGNKEAIAHLVMIIMNTVRQSAGNDMVAQQELADEQAARSNHYRLLEFPVVADLLDPDSPISETELLPVLLGEDDEAFAAAMELFDSDQQAMLAEQCKSLVAQFDAPREAWLRRLAALEEKQ